MSWKPQVQVNNEWSSNATCFETELEAQAAADDIFSRWLLTTGARAVASSDPVTHRWVPGKGLERIDEIARLS